MAQLISDSDELNLLITLGDDTAVINGTSVTGIFSNKYLAVNALGEIIESALPNFTCRTSDVSGFSNGATAVIDSTTYYIETLEDDSQGQTMIVLHK